MSTLRYPLTPHPIETLLTGIKSGEIALPEIHNSEIPAYDDFLEERRTVMAQKIKTWFEAL